MEAESFLNPEFDTTCLIGACSCVLLNGQRVAQASRMESPMVFVARVMRPDAKMEEKKFASESYELASGRFQGDEGSEARL